MIVTVEMYVAECDRCGARDVEGEHVAWTDEESAWWSAEGAGWAKITWRLLCPLCWREGDDGPCEQPPIVSLTKSPPPLVPEAVMEGVARTLAAPPPWIGWPVIFDPKDIVRTMLTC